MAYLIVALVVGWSCWVVLRRFFPKTSYAWQMQIAQALAQRQFHYLAKMMTPTMAAGCDSGCSNCGAADSACGSSVPQDLSTEKPVQWRH